jgi:hypothetical protein
MQALVSFLEIYGDNALVFVSRKVSKASPQTLCLEGYEAHPTLCPLPFVSVGAFTQGSLC